MRNPDTEIVHELDTLSRERQRLQREIEAATQQFNNAHAALLADHTARMAAIQAEIASVDGKLWSLVTAHRTWLFAPGKKFVTLPSGKLQLRAIASEVKVPNPAALMKIAVRQGLVKQIGKPPSGKWKFSLTKFRAWWQQNPGQRQLFAEQVQQTADAESLSLQPNAPHVVLPFDNQRKTPPSITIENKS